MIYILYAKESKKPTLYAKLPVTRDGEFDCNFVQPVKKKDAHGRVQVVRKAIDPLQYRSKRCYVKAAVKIDCIFIGSKPSFQVKVYDLMVFRPPERVPLVALSNEDMDDLPEELDDDQEQEEEEDNKEETQASPPVPAAGGFNLTHNLGSIPAISEPQAAVAAPSIPPPLEIVPVPAVAPAPVPNKGRKKRTN